MEDQEAYNPPVPPGSTGCERCAFWQPFGSLWVPFCSPLPYFKCSFAILWLPCNHSPAPNLNQHQTLHQAASISTPNTNINNNLQEQEKPKIETPSRTPKKPNPTPQCNQQHHTDDNISPKQTTNAEPKHNVNTPQQTPSRRRASTVTLDCFIESVGFRVLL